MRWISLPTAHAPLRRPRRSGGALQDAARAGAAETIVSLVGSVAGCLIGTFAGSLMRARVRIAPTALTGAATGYVECEDDVLRLRRITVDSSLEPPQELRGTADEVHAAHAVRCPNARSVSPAIEVVTNLRIVWPAEPSESGPTPLTPLVACRSSEPLDDHGAVPTDAPGIRRRAHQLGRRAGAPPPPA